MHRLIRFCGLLIALTLLISACAGPAPTAAPAATEAAAPTAAPAATDAPEPTEAPPAAEPKVLRTRIVADIQNLDPAFSPSHVDWAVAINVNEGLVTYAPGTWEVVNVLAESIEQSADGLTIDFKLKEGIQFHDGYGEVTAEDVKFSYERFIDPALDSPYAGDWAALDHVEVTGAYTGQIVLKEPFAPLWTTTLPLAAGWILSKRSFDENGMEWNATHPIGTGPYRFVEWRPNEAVLLERNEDYWGELPIWTEIHVVPIIEDSAAEIAIETGEIDFGEVPPAGYERILANATLEAQRIPTLDYEFVSMNAQSPKLEDVRVRQAIRAAIDVPQAIEAAHDGLWDRACAIIPAGMLGYWEEAPCHARDVEQARALLAEAGVDSLDLKIHTSPAERDRAGAEVVQAQLAEAGINVEIVVVESLWPLLSSEAVYDELELAWLSYSTNPDPSWSIVWFTCPQVGQWNTTELCIEEMDALYDSALTELDPEARAQQYVELQEVWDDAATMVWIAYRTKFFAYRSDLAPALTPHGQVIAWAFEEN